jgi:hypothetical protein
MTLLARIRAQIDANKPKVVRLPAKEVLALIAKADAAQLKAQAWDRLMRQQARRRQVDRTASAIAANPKGRL